MTPAVAIKLLTELGSPQEPPRCWKCDREMVWQSGNGKILIWRCEYCSKESYTPAPNPRLLEAAETMERMSKDNEWMLRLIRDYRDSHFDLGCLICGCDLCKRARDVLGGGKEPQSA